MPTLNVTTDTVQITCTLSMKATAKAKMFLTIALVAVCCVLCYKALQATDLPHDTANTATIYR